VADLVRQVREVLAGASFHEIGAVVPDYEGCFAVTAVTVDGVDCARVTVIWQDGAAEERAVLLERMDTVLSYWSRLSVSFRDDGLDVRYSDTHSAD
jgi:hypothetical protein